MTDSENYKEVEGQRQRVVKLLVSLKDQFKSPDLRERVIALIPSFRLLRKLGSSLIPKEEARAGMDRVLFYFRQYPFTVIRGDELMVVSGIQEWPRRLRQLRVQFGWPIASGITVRAMVKEDEFPVEDVSSMKPNEYILLDASPDREAAYRWNLANQIRKSQSSVQNKILEFLRRNVGKPVTGEELRYVAKNRTEWARRTRELRTEEGWPVATQSSGRPDLPVGLYLLESDRQTPEHDRHIPDSVRRAVLRRDCYKCHTCGWSHEDWNRSDPRHLELHHRVRHADRGSNTEENLLTLCTVCHDTEHRRQRGG